MILSEGSKLLIRQERPDDYSQVFRLVERAFFEQAYSDHQEHYLVNRLRESSNFVPQLSLVAEVDGNVAGYVLLTSIEITGLSGQYTSLAMAPLAVHPDFQKRGIGSELIMQAHNKARELGYSSVVVIGHEEYYPKFGYQLAHTFGLTFPFKAPEINCFAIELVKDGLAGVQGEVVYAAAFFED
jgi:predicted N-acetyltransferase YhbS